MYVAGARRIEEGEGPGSLMFLAVKGGRGAERFVGGMKDV